MINMPKGHILVWQAIGVGVVTLGLEEWGPTKVGVQGRMDLVTICE